MVTVTQIVYHNISSNFDYDFSKEEMMEMLGGMTYFSGNKEEEAKKCIR